jgi:uncharacterized protein
MGAQENRDLIRNGYEAFANGDMATIAQTFSPDIRWHIGGRNPLSGTYNGQDEVFGFFGKIMELSGGTFGLAIHDVLASDDHVVALAKATATRNEATLETDEVNVWHVADGRAVEFWSMSYSQAAVDEFWA